MQAVGLTVKDAKTLVSLDGGERLDYYDQVLEALGCSIETIERAMFDDGLTQKAHDPSSLIYLRKGGRTAANWFDFPSKQVLHLTNHQK